MLNSKNDRNLSNNAQFFFIPSYTDVHGIQTDVVDFRFEVFIPFSFTLTKWDTSIIPLKRKRFLVTYFS